MRIEIVAVGTELLLGQIADTNSAWLGDQLASMHVGPFSFLLQGRPNGDQRFAENFMMHLLVNDIDEWWSHIAAIASIVLFAFLVSGASLLIIGIYEDPNK